MRDPEDPCVPFPLGQTAMTPGARDAMLRNGVNAASLLDRHAAGDWGDLEPADLAVNERSLRDGDRLLSRYELEDGTPIYIITEHDRSLTTLLLPEEY